MSATRDSKSQNYRNETQYGGVMLLTEASVTLKNYCSPIGKPTGAIGARASSGLFVDIKSLNGI